MNKMKTIGIKNLGKGILISLLCLICTNQVEAKSNLFVIKQGDPLILLQNKKAIYEIDYSQLMVTDGKDSENDLDFFTWMKLKDEDNDKWTEDWEAKDKADCDKAFRDKFNSEIEKGIRLSKYGEDYKVILRLTHIDFGSAVTYSVIKGVQKGTATASGELEIKDLKTDETLLSIAFSGLKGEGSFKQIGRLKGIFENLGEELWDYLEDYQKAQKKAQKKKK